MHSLTNEAETIANTLTKLTEDFSVTCDHNVYGVPVVKVHTKEQLSNTQKMELKSVVPIHTAMEFSFMKKGFEELFCKECNAINVGFCICK